MRSRLLPLLSVCAVGTLAACGGTNYADTDHIVPAPSANQTLTPPTSSTSATGSTAATGATTTTGSTGATTVSVPSSGPLSVEPTITPPSTAAPTTLVTKDIITGTGATAKDGDELTVDYVGALYKNGKVFDASWKHGGPKGVPFSFELGVASVIPGWDKGLVGMRVGGRRELIIPPSLGYGSTAENGIPAHSTLIFIVDLLKVAPAG